jgi:hypothetical protein
MKSLPAYRWPRKDAGCGRPTGAPAFASSFLIVFKFFWSHVIFEAFPVLPESRRSRVARRRSVPRPRDCIAGF